MPETSFQYFLSYARENEDFAARLAQDLSSKGYEVFFDRTNILAGTHWTNTIQSALNDCKCLLVVLSTKAIASSNVLDETRYAHDHSTRVVPILLEECEIPFWLWRIEYVDFQGIYEQAFSKLVSELGREPRAAILPVKSTTAMAASRHASERNLVVCFDHQLLPTFKLNSNAFKLARMAESASNRQIVYYDPGVEMLGGTGPLSELRYIFRTYKRVWLGRGIAEHIKYAYAFLMDTYRPGDRLYLFGNSAGGLMAKVLADVLEIFGLLNKAGAVVVPYAVHGLERVTEREALDFKRALSRDCHPFFFGMWDCVNVQGLFRRKRTTTNLSPNTRFGYHALAIDEQRKLFRPLLWPESSIPNQTIQQVWFAGVHADISGGYSEKALSDLALRWMVGKANDCGMIFAEEEYNRLAPDPLAPMHDSLSGLWRMFGRRVRQIPAGALIHDSVRERQRKQTNYSPKNLADYDRA